MHWLRKASVTAAIALAPAALFAQACSSDDNGSNVVIPIDYDAAPLPTVKVEAGASCHSDTDCVSGLDCLYPASNCQAFQVCAPPIPETCTGAQTVCSCLGLTTQVCNGYATQPTDSTLAPGACAGGVVVTPDAGSNPVPDASPTTPDAGSDVTDGAAG